MQKITKRFVTFYAPGSFVANDWEKEIDHLDPAKIEWPDNAYSFTLHEQENVIDGDKTFVGKRSQVGPRYYHPASKVETLEQVRANPKSGRILVSNMECNGWERVVWSRWGNWPQTFDPAKDVILTTEAA